MIIGPSSAIFLDRDGVINVETPGDYIKNTGEFVFEHRAAEALQIISQYFNYLFIVTNQRGVGRGLMTETDLAGVHEYMMEGIKKAGGHIHRIYYCTSVDDKHPDRKPLPGMAFRAKADFPGIDLATSLMAGNKPGDMQFGRNAGMQTAFITSTNAPYTLPHPLVDCQFSSLYELAQFLPHFNRQF
jgi:histidinol-phosphate phosphatase family protein